MEQAWPMVPLGQVLSQSTEVLDLEPDRQYRQVTLRLWGGGVVLRNEVTGETISAKKRRVARARQFILSRIDARNGAFGLVPALLDGAVVSNDFPCFNIKTGSLEPRFLEWMSKTETFVKLCRAASEGTTNRVRLQIGRFLATPIPLPPLHEQRRILRRIDELAALIEGAQAVRAEARDYANALVQSLLEELFNRVSERFGQVEIGSFADVKGGKRLPRGDALTDIRTSYPYIRVSDMKYHSVRLEDLHYVPNHVHPRIARYTVTSEDVYVTIAGTTGYAGLVPKELSGANLTENAAKVVFRDQRRVSKEYIVYVLRSPQMQRQFGLRRTVSAQPKLALRRIRSARVPLPPLPVQQGVVQYLDGLLANVNQLLALQDATQVELDALVPSVLDRAFGGEL